MANRLGDKVLKVLQGTAAATIIARGIYDAINSIGGEDDNTNKDSKTKQENNNSNSEPNNSDSNNSDKNSSNKSDADDKGQGEGK